MDTLHALPDILTKIAVALVLGGIIGWEREALDRPAGLRTHVLVCVGSAVYMILSMSFPGRSDPGRIAAQVATGMGFLGAGTIIRHGAAVRGLTTAASLWAVAAIGLCAGRGGIGYTVGITTTLFVVIILRGLSWVEKRVVNKRQYRLINLSLGHARDTMPQLQSRLQKLGVNIRAIQIDDPGPDNCQAMRLVLRLPPGVETDHLNLEFASLQELRSLEWE